MNKELRLKLARMIIDKSREISRLAPIKHDELVEYSIQKYFENLGLQRTYEGYDVEERTYLEDNEIVYEPEENHLYFEVTAPLTGKLTVMKVDRETAEKMLVLGLP